MPLWSIEQSPVSGPEVIQKPPASLPQAILLVTVPSVLDCE